MNEVNINNNNSSVYFGQILEKYISEHYTSNYEEIIILCIGTDRCTGDSLGPLTGHKLERRIKGYSNVYLHGTLDEPVHAKNLEETIKLINNSYKKPFIIAIDACLGDINRVGCIKVSNGPLKPGAGVNKNLPPIGDINILGIVNLAGFMEFMILQNTRLQVVMKMADDISRGIEYALWKTIKDIKSKEYINEEYREADIRYLKI
ncbi:spore protease YyaC [Tepidibacter formicigenes]|jgi:putative sporulation protein YyaC|uniref:Putative sporulation protein YyaC n=1 Tax=Tepidibacter formicigenes DSM 15518 TaxID=1123349 RepID=A0A1M6M233_9FIRM|nr:spore protease YyaC [Tepidibacter formicigenes]SHJ77515.1 putative sporulation protein YyaC [Tepidibacter formicigenes DSM 15518]